MHCIIDTLWLFNITMVKRQPIEIDGLPSYKMDGFSMANCYITRWYHLTSGKRLPFANWKITIVEWVNQLYISMAMFKFANCACFLPGRVRCLDIELSRQLEIPRFLAGKSSTGDFPLPYYRMLAMKREKKMPLKKEKRQRILM